MDPNLSRTIYNTFLRRNSRFVLAMVGGALVTELIFDNAIDGWYWGKNKDVRARNTPFFLNGLRKQIGHTHTP